MPFDTLERTPVIDQVYQYLTENEIPVRSFVADIRHWIGIEKDLEAYYQRHYNLMRGKGKQLTPQEELAYKLWLGTHRDGADPVKILGKVVFELADMSASRKVEQAEKWLSSGIFNPTKARRMLKKMKRVLGRLESLPAE